MSLLNIHTRIEIQHIKQNFNEPSEGMDEYRSNFDSLEAAGLQGKIPGIQLYPLELIVVYPPPISLAYLRKVVQLLSEYLHIVSRCVPLFASFFKDLEP